MGRHCHHSVDVDVCMESATQIAASSSVRPAAITRATCARRAIPRCAGCRAVWHRNVPRGKRGRPCSIGRERPRAMPRRTKGMCRLGYQPRVGATAHRTARRLRVWRAIWRGNWDGDRSHRPAARNRKTRRHSHRTAGRIRHARRGVLKYTMQRAACSVVCTPCSVQQAACGTHHTALGAVHATRTEQHATEAHLRDGREAFAVFELVQHL